MKTLTITSTLALLLFTGACADVDGSLGTSEDSISARASFDVFEGANGLTYFHLNAANHEIILASQGYKSRTGALAGVLALALLVQFLRVGTHMVVARELGLGFGLQRGLEFLVLIPLLALAIVLPISFGGLGLREWVATRLMPQVGISAESAVVLQLSTYLVQVAVSLVGGLLLIWELARGRLLRRRNS